jgi:DNA-binding CsgD family transcriptional regulator/tetratricopeptide (TPR) repeat protein
MTECSIVGRHYEVAAIEQFLDTLGDGSRVLLVEGEPGIGKTTAVQAAARSASDRGYLVLAAAPAESEMPLDYAGMADLLATVPHTVVEGLPRPQRDAVFVSVLRTEAPTVPPDSRTIATAVVALVRELARQQPVLMLVDDLHWLDGPSADVVAFMLRRVGGSPVGLIGAVRTDWTGRLPSLMTDRIPTDRVVHLRVGPLTLGATAELLAGRCITLSRTALLALHETCRGNPLFALELAKAPAPPTGEPPARPDAPVSLRRFVSQRVETLSSPARRVLLTAALVDDPSVSTVLAAGPDRPVAAVQEAIDSGLLESRGGGLAFAHPLMRSVVVDEAPHVDRRAVHQRLAEVVSSTEQRARHLALGAPQPDDTVADEVEAAARTAAARGASFAAAQLAELAVPLTPLPRVTSRHRRSVLAAECHMQASQPGRARQLIAGVIEEMSPGPDRARLLRLQAGYLAYEGDLAGASARWDAALREAGEELALRAAIHRDMGRALLAGTDRVAASSHIEAALAYAQQAGDQTLVAQASAVQAYITFLTGGGVRQDLLDAALTGPAQPPGDILPPAVWVGYVLHLSDDLDGARALYEAEYACALEAGIETGLPLLLWAMIETEVWAGNWDRAEELAKHGAELDAESNGAAAMSIMRAVEAMVDVHRGRLEVARERAQQATELATTSGTPWAAMTAAGTSGLAGLSLGDAEAAHEALAPFAQMALAAGVSEPGWWWFLPDEIEALVRLGELDQAAAMLEPFETRSQQLGRRRGIASAGRCRGLLLAARGDLLGAEAALGCALIAHRKIQFPFDEARTLLVAGQVYRRARLKGQAGRCLRAAAETFEGLGSPLWASLARAELTRVGLRSPKSVSTSMSLTSTERRVADLVAAGRTNAEVAAQLFMGQRTVESHLSHIYRKLDVRSRTELSRNLTADRV